MHRMHPFVGNHDQPPLWSLENDTESIDGIVAA
jgi:hypothetical protein